MRCIECGTIIVQRVKLSESTIICEECYVESLDAFYAQNDGTPLHCRCHCQSPKELHEEAAAIRRKNGSKPREVKTTSRGNVPYEPKRTTRNLTGRRGTEEADMRYLDWIDREAELAAHRERLERMERFVPTGDLPNGQTANDDQGGVTTTIAVHDFAGQAAGKTQSTI